MGIISYGYFNLWGYQYNLILCIYVCIYKYAVVLFLIQLRNIFIINEVFSIKLF